MAGKSAGQGRAFQHRERCPVGSDHPASRGDCQPQDDAPGAQGLPSISSSRYQRHGYDQLHRRLEPPRASIWHGDAAKRSAADGHANAAATASHAEEVIRSLDELCLMLAERISYIYQVDEISTRLPATGCAMPVAGRGTIIPPKSTMDLTIVWTYSLHS